MTIISITVLAKLDDKPLSQVFSTAFRQVFSCFTQQQRGGFVAFPRVSKTQQLISCKHNNILDTHTAQSDSILLLRVADFSFFKGTVPRLIKDHGKLTETGGANLYKYHPLSELKTKAFVIHTVQYDDPWWLYKLFIPYRKDWNLFFPQRAGTNTQNTLKKPKKCRLVFWGPRNLFFNSCSFRLHPFILGSENYLFVCTHTVHILLLTSVTYIYILHNSLYTVHIHIYWPQCNRTAAASLSHPFC